jgi:hypothetical protein
MEEEFKLDVITLPESIRSFNLYSIIDDPFPFKPITVPYKIRRSRWYKGIQYMIMRNIYALTIYKNSSWNYVIVRRMHHTYICKIYHYSTVVNSFILKL